MHVRPRQLRRSISTSDHRAHNLIRVHVFPFTFDDAVVSFAGSLGFLPGLDCRAARLHRLGSCDHRERQQVFTFVALFRFSFPFHLTTWCVLLVCASPLSPTASRRFHFPHLIRRSTPVLSTTPHAIFVIISKVLEFFRKMGKKVTYGKSDNGKRHLPCDTDSAHEHEDSRKRSKTDDELEKLRFPGRQAKKSSLLKKSLHSGPVSFTNEDGDIEPPKKKNVFDKVLSEGRYQAAKPGQVRFSGDRNGFAGLMRKNQRSEEHEGRKRNSYLPTPPADAERKAHQQTRRDTTFSHTNGSASKGGLKTPSKSATPTQTSQLFERVIKYEQPKQPYQPKAYKADETPAPAMDILGGRLPEKSKEAEL
jgi:hypothetical protein